MPRATTIVLSILSLSLSALAQEKLPEESFENGLGQFSITSWRGTAPGQITETAAHSGKQSVQLVGGAAADDVTVLWWKNPGIKLLPGQQYTASAWVKTENAAAVELHIVMPDGVAIDGLKTDKLTGTADWKKLEQRFTVAAPAQPQHIGVFLTGPGKAWVDDFRLDGKTGLAWAKTIEIDPAGTQTERDFMALLKQQNLDSKEYVNWYSGRFPTISFIGGTCNGNSSEDMEFFFEKPFRYYNQVLDFAMENGGEKYGIRARIRRYKEGKGVKPLRSFLLSVRCDTILKEYHPSYILVNGRRVWDAKKHPLHQGKIVVPFSLEEPVDPIIDFVIDRAYTPQVKGLAFRMFFVNYLGEPGTRVDLKGAATEKEESPADKLQRFQFGLFPADWDFWGDRGTPFAEIKKTWKPNFRPAYPTDDVYLSPVIFGGSAKSKYHEFMVTYGGCNVLAGGADVTSMKLPHVRGVLSSSKDGAENKAILAAGLSRAPLVRRRIRRIRLRQRGRPQGQHG